MVTHAHGVWRIRGETRKLYMNTRAVAAITRNFNNSAEDVFWKLGRKVRAGLARACLLSRSRRVVVLQLQHVVRTHFIIVMIRWTGLAPWESKGAASPFVFGVELAVQWLGDFVPATRHKIRIKSGIPVCTCHKFLSATRHTSQIKRGLPASETLSQCTQRWKQKVQEYPGLGRE